VGTGRDLDNRLLRLKLSHATESHAHATAELLALNLMLRSIFSSCVCNEEIMQ
jgi:hypothetical protein